MNDEGYHRIVADYYGEEAASFETRAKDNHVLVTLRDRFREVVMGCSVEHLLEIGYGPGLDMVWFSEQAGVKCVNGLDITPEFHNIVSEKAKDTPTMKPFLGGPENCLEHIQPNSIDTIYVFFGALNTSANLENAVKALSDVVKPGGKIVATFVNKWYAFDIFWNIITLRPKKAVARLRSIWGGYSPTRFLPSRCYSARQVHSAFHSHFNKRRRIGYCITHPAWYRAHWAPHGSLRSSLLYRIDSLLQYTPFWNLGEYSLYVYDKSE